MSAGHARSILLAPSAARTASGDSGTIPLPGGLWRSCIIRLDVTPVTGTSPTLDLYVQHGVRDVGNATLAGLIADGDPVWNDFAAFAQITAAAEHWATIVSAGAAIGVASDAALSAGSVVNGPIGGFWRVKWVIGGTNPSFTFDVVAMLIP